MAKRYLNDVVKLFLEFNNIGWIYPIKSTYIKSLDSELWNV